MKFILGIVLAVVVVHAFVWLLYLSVMRLQAKREAGLLSPLQVRLGKAYTFACLAIDVLANIFVTPFIFGEIAQELTISARLRRWVKSPDCRNRRLAVWFAEKLLNPYSVGGPHIKILGEVKP